MKTTDLKLLALLAFASAGPAFAAETVPEKVESTSKDAARDVKKAGNRVEEELCMGTKAECAKKKVKNRGEETKDKVEDKASDVKNNVD
jgi:hypothetical protein